ncbi:multiple epidermal growth factor-like domains protein 10 [Mytilus californianus]|uniref:multiple epidermal growth factor-like domains protein 10 n=1 Tax=Mytilus californianus TaxID=6549 RepID=UPI002248289E|nr:multiple epidermal growth factor-like domains protein 10 [Mytilus californianus]
MKVREISECLTILLFTVVINATRGFNGFYLKKCKYLKSLPGYDHNGCCYINFEEINGECIRCKPGFTSKNGKVCEPCPIDLYGDGCWFACYCNDSQRCDHVKGCVDAETTTTLHLPSRTEETGSVEQKTRLSQTELLVSYLGASTGIMILFVILGILYYLNNRNLMEILRRT